MPDILQDPYRWLEDLDSPETRAWIESQNKKTFDFLERIPQREAIRRRMTELSNYEKCGVPFKEGGRYFFLKNDGLQNQSAVYTLDRLDGAPRALLDPNTLSPDGTIALNTIQAARDGKLLAYSLSGAGSDWQEWRIRDVETGIDLPDHIRWVKFSSVSWTTDNKGFFYCRYDEPKEDVYQAQNFFQKVCYHRAGTPQPDDRLVYERPDQKEWNFDIVVSDDGSYLIIQVWTGSTQNNLVFYKDLRNRGGPFVELIANFEARYYFAGNDGSLFFFHTDADAPRGRVIGIDTLRPTKEFWREIVPQTAYAIEQVQMVGDSIIVRYLRDAHSRVKIFEISGKFVRDLELPGFGTATGFAGRRDDPETFFDFSAFTTPACVYHYNVATGARRLFHQPRLLFDPAEYETSQIFYSSKDGTSVPMFITHKGGLKLDGQNPSELYGYGGFNVSVTPAFSVARLVWMEMGGVFAVANIRGGGEYGEEWHQAGIKSRRQNCFDDFIAAAEWLIANKITSTPKLVIGGRSNGGLLVGACIMQRPDLFGAAVPGVGVMDMLRFHKFTIGWSWVSDYGSPDDPEDFKYLFAYSPYHNIRKGTAYPATLVVTGDHDDRVVPGHSYKFAAALQAAQSGPAPVLIRIDVRGGHGMGKPITKLIDEWTDILSFYVGVLL